MYRVFPYISRAFRLHTKRSLPTPVTRPEAYRQMIDTAKIQSFAFAAVNCVGSEAVNA